MTSSHLPPHARVPWPVWLAGVLIVTLVAVEARRLLPGWLPDNDDMMRLQQIRDLLAGQAWFDVSQHRLSSPEGGVMHWSRLPDLVPATLIMIARPVVGQAHAEMLALIVWPLLLLGATLSALRTVAARLGAGPSGQVATLVFFALSSAVVSFWPGRIDHHGLVVLLVIVGFAAVLDHQLRARSGCIAALCTATMIAVAIESLPYAGGLVAAVGLAWIIRGHRESTRLVAFGLTLAIVALVLFIVDAPGISAARQVCDSYGTAHLGGLVGGGLSLAALGMFGGNIAGWRVRLAIGLSAGLVVVALMLAVNPACLADPYASVSEQARTAWLSAVGEARGWRALWVSNSSQFITQFGFALAGLCGALGLVLHAPKGKRLAAGSLVMMMALALLAMAWQVRGVNFAHVFAAVATGWWIGDLFDRYRSDGGARHLAGLVAALMLLAPSSWQVWAKLGTPTPSSQQDRAGNDETCRQTSAFRQLDLPQDALILAPIDLGTLILAYTPYRTLGAPYHRNVASIETITRTFASAPEQAHEILTATAADYLLYCPGLAETTRYARLHPDGLAAQLEARRLPDWLEPVDGLGDTDGTVRLYRIRRK